MSNQSPAGRTRTFFQFTLLALITVATASCRTTGEADSARQIRAPHLVGDWWQIASNPDLGALTSAKQQPVDFAIWPAADGTWQVWSCIRSTKSPGGTRLLHGWEGKDCTDKNWQPMGIAMQADAKYGERPGGLQSPFVLRDENTFKMFYGSWDHLGLAVSADGKKFVRKLNSAGMSRILGADEEARSRDPMVTRIGGVCHLYYTAHPGRKGAIYCRTSTDLKNWSASRVVSRGGRAGTGPYSAECPFVVELSPGRFYLFRTQEYGKNARTNVYFSRNPLDFGVDNDEGYFVCDLPVAAPEIFKHRGQWHIAALLPGLNGIQIGHLTWE